MVGVACSAGGLAPLRSLVGGLPEALPASVLVVRHLGRDAKPLLPGILTRGAVLPVEFAVDGEPVRPGRVRIAPPDRHLTVHDGWLRVAGTPKINRVRPAADALFRSLARWYGPRVVAVVLSGTLDDGAAGAAAVAARGGTVIVQDPAEAEFSSMPRQTLGAVPGAETVPTNELAAAILDLLGSQVGEPPGLPPDLIWETDLTDAVGEGPDGVPGRPAAVTCPSCHGAMNQVDALNDLHFRCHTGHVYSPATLVADQEDAGEAALWHAVALLEERAMVHHELALRAGRLGARAEERAHMRAALDARRAAEAVRALIPEPESEPEPEPESEPEPATGSGSRFTTWAAVSTRSSATRNPVPRVPPTTRTCTTRPRSGPTTACRPSRPLPGIVIGNLPPTRLPTTGPRLDRLQRHLDPLHTIHREPRLRTSRPGQQHHLHSAPGILVHRGGELQLHRPHLELHRTGRPLDHRPLDPGPDSRNSLTKLRPLFGHARPLLQNIDI